VRWVAPTIEKRPARKNVTDDESANPSPHLAQNHAPLVAIQRRRNSVGSLSAHEAPASEQLSVIATDTSPCALTSIVITNTHAASCVATTGHCLGLASLVGTAVAQRATRDDD
jgi:hypothetical protein